MKVDDFVAKRFIGSGFYSLVYEVELKGDFEPKKAYALKRICLKTKATNKRALRERKVLEVITTDGRTNKSSFLPTLYAAFLISRTSAALVIPAESGVDLYALWKAHRPFDEEEVLFYGAEILCGLEALHALQIVHVDLKSGNVIIIMPSGHIMLIDFDHSLDISSGPRQHSDRNVGTAMYRPSELANFGFISEKSDIWCWAIILLELLCQNDAYHDFALYGARKKKAFLHRYLRCSETLMNLLLRCFHECADDRPCLSAINQHDFFGGLNWEDVESCKLEPPERLDVSNCYQDPRESDPLVLKIFREAEMIHTNIEIVNGKEMIRHEWEEYDEESDLLYYEYESELEKFDFVHHDEFLLVEEEQERGGKVEEEEEEKGEVEKKSKFCKCC